MSTSSHSLMFVQVHTQIFFASLPGARPAPVEELASQLLPSRIFETSAAATRLKILHRQIANANRRRVSSISASVTTFALRYHIRADAIDTAVPRIFTLVNRFRYTLSLLLWICISRERRIACLQSKHLRHAHSACDLLAGKRRGARCMG